MLARTKLQPKIEWYTRSHQLDTSSTAHLILTIISTWGYPADQCEETVVTFISCVNNGREPCSKCSLVGPFWKEYQFSYWKKDYHKLQYPETTSEDYLVYLCTISDRRLVVIVCALAWRRFLLKGWAPSVGSSLLQSSPALHKAMEVMPQRGRRAMRHGTLKDTPPNMYVTPLQP